MDVIECCLPVLALANVEPIAIHLAGPFKLLRIAKKRLTFWYIIISWDEKLK
jgi:hypothetical protein